ncbi:hypothetical protein FRC06_001269 [Ceratobasidium sp. 370]|nr:hypothetical protein FRC06_001269 [Ceratobasidium sp. 370]
MVVSKSDYKRLFIQAMMQRRWVSETTAKLERFDLRLSNAKDECTGETIWAIINTKQDPATMLATEYNPTEIQYFKLVVEQIVLANNDAYSIPAMAALREVSQLQGKGITKSEAEHLLSSFVAKGWLLKSKRGRYSLSSRSLLELQTYLRETYPDEYNECTYCMCKQSWRDDAVKKVGEEGIKGDHVHRRVTRGGDEEEEKEEEEVARMEEEEEEVALSQDQMDVDEPRGKSKKKGQR